MMEAEVELITVQENSTCFLRLSKNYFARHIRRVKSFSVTICELGDSIDRRDDLYGIDLYEIQWVKSRIEHERVSSSWLSRIVILNDVVSVIR